MTIVIEEFRVSTMTFNKIGNNFSVFFFNMLQVSIIYFLIIWSASPMDYAYYGKKTEMTNILMQFNFSRYKNSSNIPKSRTPMQTHTKNNVSIKVELYNT